MTTPEEPGPTELRERLARAEAECNRLRLEIQLLRNELLRHDSGMLQIRAVERKLSAITRP